MAVRAVAFVAAAVLFLIGITMGVMLAEKEAAIILLLARQVKPTVGLAPPEAPIQWRDAIPIKGWWQQPVPLAVLDQPETPVTLVVLEPLLQD